MRSIGQVQIVEVITTVGLEEPHYARNHDDCQMKGERGFDNSPQMRVALVGTLRLVWAVGTARHVRAGCFWSHYGCEDLDSILAIAATEKNEDIGFIFNFVGASLCIMKLEFWPVTQTILVY